ncbi:hypothetical protein [Brevibacillus sp. SAFN-007a]|uniref:hypothetical protein n=1 Tax=Brevibacillus sp. SAFN-007a TaxID=3436862 RepID=UPI003F7E7EFE
MKKFVSFMSIFVLMLVAFVQGVSAEKVSANPKVFEFSQTDIENLKDRFSELGIDEKTQNTLIKKLENGEVLDSMKEENLQKAKAQIIANGENSLNKSRVITFNDGSKIMYGTRLVDSEIQPMVSPGSYMIESYWFTGIVNFGFYSDIVIVSGNNNDYIVDSYDPYVSVLGGSFTPPTVGIKRKYETSTRRAYSQMDFTYTIPTGQSTMKLYLNVGDNDYETTLSKDDVK